MTPATGSGGADPVEVRVDGKLRPLIPRFLENRRDETTALLDAVERADFEALAGAGHALKGTAASFGFDRLAEWGMELEGRAGDEDLSGAAEIVEAMSDYLNRVEVVYDD